MTSFLYTAYAFYKLAMEASQKDYDLALAQYRTNVGSKFFAATDALEEAGRFVRQWQSTPHYKLQDGLDLIKIAFNAKDKDYHPETFRTHFLIGSGEILNQAAYSYLEAIIDEVLDYKIKQLNESDFNSSLWRLNELLGLQSEVVTAAQKDRLNKDILQYLLHRPEEVTSDEDENHLIDEFVLLHNMQWSPVTLMNLAKKVSPDFNAKFHRKIEQKKHEHKFPPVPWENPITQWIQSNKKEFTEYDIGQWFYYLNATYSYIGNDQFQFVLPRCTKKAIEYLRGYLYRSMEDDIFMIDESLQPMNNEMDTIPWPHSFYPRTLSGINPAAEQAKWAQLFADFKIIPHQ